MTYTRTFVQSLTSGVTNQIFVQDTANNKSTPLDIDIAIDTHPPVVSITGTNNLALTVSDNDSKIWPAGIITKTVPLANISTP